MPWLLPSIQKLRASKNACRLALPTQYSVAASSLPHILAICWCFLPGWRVDCNRDLDACLYPFCFWLVLSLYINTMRKRIMIKDNTFSFCFWLVFSIMIMMIIEVTYFSFTKGALIEYAMILYKKQKVHHHRSSSW